jgi:hypothetical protein
MLKKTINILKQISENSIQLGLLRKEVSRLAEKTDEQKILQGKTLSKLNMRDVDAILKNIHLAEFKVFSQWGDDGIIQFLVNYLDIQNKTFIEFGVQDYKEANTRFLLINDNWKGMIMDGSEGNMRNVKAEKIYWKHNLIALPLFVTKDNINTVMRENGLEGEIGLLHIDIDGNDYWIWKEIKNISPVIVIMEYNSVFGSEKPWTTPYDKDFDRTNYHHSNLCYGPSLTSLCDLAEEKGYAFIGCNSNGNNAYFIRKDKMKNLRPLSAAEGFVNSEFRESRDAKGNLTYLAGNERLKAIAGMQVFNTRTGQVEKITVL